MLYLISLGLFDEKDMSLRALETAKKCDSLYVEFFTTKMFTDAQRISILVGKPVREIMRSDLEDRMEKLLREARTKDVGIMVGGDALVATTHVALLIEAKKLGVETRIIHGSSIYSAIAKTGLQIYKFGRTTTLALPQKNYYPTSCYDAIAHNAKAGLHTLVLLDVRSHANEYMSVREGLEILLDIEKEKKQGIIKPDTMVVAACVIGSEDEVIRYASVKKLLEEKIEKTPAILIIPGELHFLEEDFLKLFFK
jgi:diphthine synthase